MLAWSYGERLSTDKVFLSDGLRHRTWFLWAIEVLVFKMTLTSDKSRKASFDQERPGHLSNNRRLNEGCLDGASRGIY